MKTSHTSLQQRWKEFFNVVFEPVNILLVGVTIALYFVSTKNDSTYMAVLLYLLVSMCSGEIGARVTARRGKNRESHVLVARANSAIRSLILLLNKGISLETRVRHHLKRLTEKKQSDDEIVKINFEEIIEALNSLQENTIHSIEDWKDIVPKANSKSEIGVITNLKKQVFMLALEQKNISEKLGNETKATQEEKKILEQKLQETKIELAEARDKLSAKETIFENSPLSGISATSSFLHGLEDDVHGLKEINETFRSLKEDTDKALLPLAELNKSIQGVPDYRKPQ